MKIEEEIGRLLRKKGLTLSTAESCTGGGIAALITSVPGSSQYFKGGIIAYSNEIKQKMLHVSTETLKTWGAVSRETVVEMALGAAKEFHSDCVIATSGIAGPDGGTLEKPVGTIWIAIGYKNDIVTIKEEGDAGRIKNIEKTILKSLTKLYEKMKNVEKAISQ